MGDKAAHDFVVAKLQSVAGADNPRYATVQ